MNNSGERWFSKDFKLWKYLQEQGFWDSLKTIDAAPPETHLSEPVPPPSKPVSPKRLYWGFRYHLMQTRREEISKPAPASRPKCPPPCPLKVRV